MNSSARPLSPSAGIWDVFAVTASTMGADIVTPYHALMVILFFMAEEYFVEGGTHQATIALHRLLGDKALLGAEVTEVKRARGPGPGHLRPRRQEETVHARRCVLANQAPLPSNASRTSPTGSATPSPRSNTAP